MKRASCYLNSGFLHFPIIIITFFFFLASLSLAGPVKKGQAQQAARGWLKQNKRPMQRSISNHSVGIEAMADDTGQTLCYIVNLDPAGFVVLSADDEIEPVIAFSSTGSYDGDKDSPLTTLLTKDMTGRMEKIRRKGHKKAGASGKSRKWQLLFEEDDRVLPQASGSIEAASATSVSEVWVDPFIQSEWDQKEADDGNCYNYYTPNNYYCGCVATTMAQVMRYHSWPTGGIGVHGFSIEVNGIEQTWYTRGGNGSGGAYLWSQMPLIPENGLTPTQREAIGALCYDAGVAANMSYTSTGSGASLTDADEEMTNTFGYSNSVYTQSFSSLGDGRLWNILNANMDAQLPVILGISRSGGGHAVIADGYGYTGQTLYHHINMGWGGYDNAWYQLPTIDATSHTYTVIDDCIYNIYTSGTGEIISGRVTNMAGSPLSGVTVGAYIGTTLIKQTTTNDRGVYALIQLSSNTTYTMSAAKTGENFLDQTVTTGSSSDWSTPGNRSGILFVSANTGPPTAYDMEVDVDAVDAAYIQLEGLDDGVPDPNLFRCIITSLPSHGQLSEPNVGVIGWIPYELQSSIRDVNYVPCPYFGGQDSFTYKANDGGTYPTGGDSNIATVTVNVNDQLYTDFDEYTNTYSTLLMGTGSYYDARAQIIMLQSEIGGARKITDLALDVYDHPGGILNNWTIRMQHTDWTYYPDNYDVTYMLLTSGWETVYQANETITQPGWHNFHFDVPFEYNGTQNLLIDFSFNNSGTTAPNGGYLIQTATGPDPDRSLGLASTTGTHGDPLQWDFWALGGSYFSGYAPSMKFISKAMVEPLTGDFDASCNVRIPDLAIFSQAWMTSSSDTAYKAECDMTTTKGDVDLQDLMIFAGQWLQVYSY